MLRAAPVMLQPPNPTQVTRLPEIPMSPESLRVLQELFYLEPMRQAQQTAFYQFASPLDKAAKWASDNFVLVGTAGFVLMLALLTRRR